MTKYSMPALTPAMIKARVRDVQGAYVTIQHEAWNGRFYADRNGDNWSDSQMWIEASKIIEDEWREIIRVLAQGGDCYSIVWPV